MMTYKCVDAVPLDTRVESVQNTVVCCMLQCCKLPDKPHLFLRSYIQKQSFHCNHVIQGGRNFRFNYILVLSVTCLFLF